MAQRRGDRKDATQEKDKRRERADRILAAAAELTLRWGYQKTTIDDIARQAGVAKGTIYIHWKTREDLFLMMLLREQKKVLAEMLARLQDDPEGVMLHAMMKHALIAMEHSPLIKATLLKDTDMLGDLLHIPMGDAMLQQKMLFSDEYLQFLRDAGLLRTDQDLKTQTYMLSAIVMGYLLIDPLLPDQYRYTPEEAGEMLAENIKRTLEPTEPIPVERREAANAQFQQLFALRATQLEEWATKEYGL